MKAAMVFTGSGPILILTTFESLEDPRFLERLSARGIKKFIAHEVSVDQVKKSYGTRFSVILGDLSQTDDLRVMDIDGHHVMNTFTFEELGPPIYHEHSEMKPAVTGTVEGDWIFAQIGEYGELTEASYLPMVGSHIQPSVALGAAARHAKFLIDSHGMITDASPAALKGHRIILHGRSAATLGRTDTSAPACTWVRNEQGGWSCI